MVDCSGHSPTESEEVTENVGRHAETTLGLDGDGGTIAELGGRGLAEPDAANSENGYMQS